ncbi:MAG: hypothetical protein JO122_05810 [Acetobacteraceae bacterium]|nr:hypothetical protein [Acetobacteraceae bacterium]
MEANRRWQQLRALRQFCAVDQPVSVNEERHSVQGDPLTDRPQISGAELAGDDLQRRAHP